MNNQHVAEESMKKRLFNLNIIYPPSLVTSAPLQILLADWTSNFNISDISDRIDKSDTVIDGSSGSGSGSSSGSGSDSNRSGSGSDSRNICPIYLLKTAGDLFGCEIQESEFKISQDFNQGIQTQPTHPMLSMLSMGADNEYTVAVR